MKAIQGSNKLAGRELLGKKSLGTEELIVKYLDKVMEDRGTSVWVTGWPARPAVAVTSAATEAVA